MLCQQYLGIGPRNLGLIKGVSILKKMPPTNDGNNIYYEYYATQAMHHMGGDAWDFWNLGPNGTGQGGVRDVLIAKQDKLLDLKRPLPANRSHQDGSWDPNGPWGLDGGGRLMYTSLSLLTLEVYYRHLPLYRREMNVNKEDAAGERQAEVNASGRRKPADSGTLRERRPESAGLHRPLAVLHPTSSTSQD